MAAMSIASSDWTGYPQEDLALCIVMQSGVSCHSGCFHFVVSCLEGTRKKARAVLTWLPALYEIKDLTKSLEIPTTCDLFVLIRYGPVIH